MSWLLEPTNHTARDLVSTRAKKIYGLRFQLVHGSTTKPDQVKAAADELSEWLGQAFAALLTTDSPLLATTDRARVLALQDPAAIASDTTFD